MFKLSKQLLKRQCSRLSFPGILIVFLLSCQKQDDVGLGMQEHLGTDVTDTATIYTSTFLLDSLPTAGKGVMLVGRIADPELGNIQSSSYFQVAPDGISPSALSDDAKFDSVRVKLKYSGYYYGDTSVTQEISIYKLKNRISLPTSGGIKEPEEENVFSGGQTFYNRTKLEHESDPVGKISFKPRPASQDTLVFRLNQSVGSELFSLIKDGSSLISSSEEFLDYFKGLVLVPGSDKGNAVIGYTDTAEVKIYYSYASADGFLKRGELKFSLNNNSYQFNNITADRSGTKLKNISLINHEVPASQTSELSYIQGGTGLVTKIHIPYLGYIAKRENSAINKAELIIRIPPGYNDLFTLPSQLVLLVANENNKPVSILSDSRTSVSSLSLQNSLNDGMGTAYYTFPLTDYVTKSSTVYLNTSLFLSLPVADLQKSLGRLVIGSASNIRANIQLKITYTNLNL
ncbi:DUF4270 family protein [Pararcticibacter amylolyticus]|uniref:DUF4270 domain-containing protein n=1 Tax=Pararcticibacter amylolyticus TaxID=2173175 RepID=A0A2U2PI49_9SPHI|nr:DUF4270 family protein [Pararcticibacter amylolyticus]PWG81088.1 hypothetical protein DDR33_09180 [Pararcticibacter amylolyticus]